SSVKFGCGGVADRGRDRRGYVRVEDRGDDVVRADLVRRDHVGQRLRGGDQHVVGDVPALRVEQPAEHAGEGQHVVDLVRVVAAAGGHHRGVLAGRVRVDLGIGVGQGEHDAVGGPGLDVFAGEDVRGGQADEHVGTGQRPGQVARVAVA